MKIKLIAAKTIEASRVAVTKHGNNVDVTRYYLALQQNLRVFDCSTA